MIELPWDGLNYRQAVDLIRQVLQRTPPLFSQFMVVIGRRSLVPLGMSKQEFDNISPKTMLPQQGRTSPSCAMRRKIRHSEIKSFEEVIERRIAKRHGASQYLWEDVALGLLTEGSQKPKQFQRLL